MLHIFCLNLIINTDWQKSATNREMLKSCDPFFFFFNAMLYLIKTMTKKNKKQPKPLRRILIVNNEKYFSLKLLSLCDEKKQKGKKERDESIEKLMFTNWNDDKVKWKRKLFTMLCDYKHCMWKDFNDCEFQLCSHPQNGMKPVVGWMGDSLKSNVFWD